MNATIGKAWTQWFVAPHDGGRGGIAVASKREALALCKARGWIPVDSDGRPIRDTISEGKPK
jgi:hypothetical protein